MNVSLLNSSRWQQQYCARKGTEREEYFFTGNCPFRSTIRTYSSLINRELWVSSVKVPSEQFIIINWRLTVGGKGRHYMWELSEQVACAKPVERLREASSVVYSHNCTKQQCEQKLHHEQMIFSAFDSSDLPKFRSWRSGIKRFAFSSTSYFHWRTGNVHSYTRQVLIIRKKKHRFWTNCVIPMYIYFIGVLKFEIQKIKPKS